MLRKYFLGRYAREWKRQDRKGGDQARVPPQANTCREGPTGNWSISRTQETDWLSYLHTLHHWLKGTWK